MPYLCSAGNSAAPPMELKVFVGAINRARNTSETISSVFRECLLT